MNVLNFSAIPVLAEVDILVVGAGSAGCSAALAARESGKHLVLLVERYGFAGGSSTGVLTTFYGFFTPGDAPRKVVGGVPDRVVDELDKRRAMYLRPNTYGAGTGVTYNPETLKLVWDEMLARAGVQVWFGCQLVDVESDESGPTHAVFWSKSGFFKVAAKRFIDASGDADFCHHAGYASEKAGDFDPAQTLTTTFRMSNVDWSEFESSGGKTMLMQQMSDAVDAGFPLPRKAGSAHLLPMQGVISTVAVRVANVDALDFQDLSRAEIEGRRRQAFIYEQFFRERVTGFENSDIVSLSVGIGVRETRRVYGEYRLTRDDCFAVRRFDDRVLLCGAPIEDHRAGKNGEVETVWGYIPGNDAYDVPYRTLVPRGSNTVWMVGRCFSATHDAHASCRSMGQTMSMGQAAGLAAVLSLETDAGAREIDVSELQNRLRDLGAILEMPDHVAATAARAWRENFDHLVI